MTQKKSGRSREDKAIDDIVKMHRLSAQFANASMASGINGYQVTIGMLMAIIDAMDFAGFSRDDLVAEIDTLYSTRPEPTADRRLDS